MLTCARTELAPECRRDPDFSHHFVTDLADPASVTAFVAQGAAALGGIDALINNAAIERVQGFLEASHFFDPLHAQVYEVAAKLITAFIFQPLR